MAKRKLTGKEIIDHLHAEGFKKVGAVERKTGWHKKALEKPGCLTRKVSYSTSR